eukprot:TRINITY_DN19273_c1_g1_i1.p1 TRINITY_DN19273_c1_g1~~TRINITY_DN19273_c1_g1_i1.p1  ORF type:complete len:307 (-),score=61.88 TRINITY_DN19273_c1_g1_i1:300-1220(-)
MMMGGSASVRRRGSFFSVEMEDATDGSLSGQGREALSSGVAAGKGLPRFIVMHNLCPALLVTAGILEGLLGALHGHWWGAFMGVLAIVAGGTLFAYRHPKGVADVLVWILFSYVLLLVLVRLASLRGWEDLFPPTPSAASPHFFPQECAPSKLLGCARVALTNSHPNKTAVPLELPVYIKDAVQAVRDWSKQGGGRILIEQQEPSISIMTAGRNKCTVYFHLRALTFFMGFADDVFVNVECRKGVPGGASGSGGQVVVSIQSQLRIGKSDLGVNGRRIARFYAFLEKQLAKAEQGDCTKRLSAVTT